MLTIVTALLCEARPLIEYYKLKKTTHNRDFQIYTSPSIKLIISGVGRIAAAAATAYIQALNDSPKHSAWLNIGICGHSQRMIGDSFIAHKIHDLATQTSYYPSLVFDPACHSDILNTVDQPDHEYLYTGGVDMEAAAFYASANRFTISELIQSYKVVSDNPSSVIKKIKAKQATDLIQHCLDQIITIIEQVQGLSDELNKAEIKLPKIYPLLVKKHQLSHSDSQQLQTRLKRLILLKPDPELFKGDPYELRQQKSKVELFVKLDQLISDQRILF